MTDTEIYPHMNRSRNATIALAATVALVGIVAAVFTILAVAGRLDETSTPILISLLGLVVTAVPALISAGFAKQAADDIRNGVITEKVIEGATKALDNTGVTEVVALTNRGESSVMAMQALARLLEQNTLATRINTEQQEGNPTHE